MHVSTCWSISFFYLFFSGHAARHAGSLFPDHELNLCLLQWKQGALTTGPPGKSQPIFFRWENWGRKKKGDLLKDTQLHGGRTWTLPVIDSHKPWEGSDILFLLSVTAWKAESLVNCSSHKLANGRVKIENPTFAVFKFFPHPTRPALKH